MIIFSLSSWGERTLRKINHLLLPALVPESVFILNFPYALSALLTCVS